MSSPLQYNEFVQAAFAAPQFILTTKDESSYTQSVGGDRETGVEFKLLYDKTERALWHKVYGSPYAVAAGELLCRKFAADALSLGDKLDLEQFKTELDMPYNYFFILLALEDAWNELLSVIPA